MKSYWAGRGTDNAHSSADYVSVETVALTAYLHGVTELPERGRAGLLYTVATRAVAKMVDANAHTGFTGASSVRTRAKLFQEAEAEARADGKDPSAFEVIDRFNASLTPRQIREGERLRYDEIALYRGGGNLSAGSYEWFDQAGPDPHEQADRQFEANQQLTELIARVVSIIVRENPADTGLIWFCVNLGQYIERFPDFDRDNDIAEVAAAAGVSADTGRRYYGIVLANPDLMALVESGSGPEELIEPVSAAAPSDVGVVSYARALLRVIARASPGDMGILTYTTAWLGVTQTLGRRARMLEVVSDVAEKYGATAVNPDRTKFYQKRLAAVLREVTGVMTGTSETADV
ncbi:hypothetical protein [Microbacterium enclense]|uniref:hypothetical protein n=1 Tax=Microbacterium enclense TaxID=993073 RepID=UPI003F7E9E00